MTPPANRDAAEPGRLPGAERGGGANTPAKPPPSASPFHPVRMVERKDAPGLGLVVGVAVVLLALLLLLLFALAWFQ